MIHHTLHHTVFRASEIRELEAATIRDAGIAGDLLMEIAGFQAAREIMSRQGENKRGLIVCGRGNNGGDALVVARYLLRNGFRLMLWIADGQGPLSPDAETNLKRLRASAGGAFEGNITQLENLADAGHHRFDFAVDGLFGTGLNKEITGPYRDAVNLINRLDTVVYAMDIPSGMDADTGNTYGVAVQATVTCTFGGYKHGLFTPEGFRLGGETVFCELPFPRHLYPAPPAFAIHPDLTRTAPATEQKGLHKYDRGIVYVLGGSPGLTGAPILSARAAWSAGPGAVIAVCPAGLMPVFEKNLVEPVKKPVGNTGDHHFRQSHTDQVLEIIAGRPGVLVIGPGMGREQETARFVHEVVKKSDCPMVIDADALWCLSRLDALPELGDETVLTPHPGELQSLMHTSTDNCLERLDLANELSARTGAITVAKGAPTYVTGSPAGTFVTAYDTTLFGRIGFGDVLAGKIAAAMATGYAPATASVHALLEGYRRYLSVSSTEHIPGPADII
jgi:ADP-dependent NAD(P)H-hydrate dehydratase / NAD(P)H-hydrate epimerase